MHVYSDHQKQQCMAFTHGVAELPLICSPGNPGSTSKLRKLEGERHGGQGRGKGWLHLTSSLGKVVA